MAKQISDKKRELLKCPVKKRWKIWIGRNIYVKKGNIKMMLGCMEKVGWNPITERLSWNGWHLIKFLFFQGAYRKVIKGEKDPELPIANTSKNCYSCLFAKSTMAKASLMWKHQKACPLDPQKGWIKKTAVWWGPIPQGGQQRGRCWSPLSSDQWQDMRKW